MADEDFDGDDLEEVDGEVETSVQLGFAFDDATNALFSDPNWREWDGGKIGGKPVWLDPVNLPAPGDLMCGFCAAPTAMVLQIYCPLDEVKDAFHRALYVFACRKKGCVEKGSVKCLRCQLPKQNPYYPFNPDESLAVPTAVGYVPAPAPVLCVVCGQRGPHCCSRCKNAHYCSREHQRSHWKYHKTQCGGGGAGATEAATDDTATLVLPEYSLEVSQEVQRDRKDDALEEMVMKANVWDDATLPEVADDDDEEEDDDAALTQSDYNKALGNDEVDPAYTKFMERVRRGGGDQVLRYVRWEDDEGPLRLSSLADTPAAPDVCPHCGAQRKFEFQIMPQLLHYLRVDRHTKVTDASRALACQSAVGPGPEQPQPELPVELESVVENKADEDIDWGTIDVYTCTASCAAKEGDAAAAYRAEAVVMSKPVEFRKKKKSSA